MYARSKWTSEDRTGSNLRSFKGGERETCPITEETVKIGQGRPTGRARGAEDPVGGVTRPALLSHAELSLLVAVGRATGHTQADSL